MVGAKRCFFFILFFCGAFTDLFGAPTIDDIRHKWLPDIITTPFIHEGSGDFPPIKEPQGKPESNDVLILEVAPLVHLVRFSIFNDENFFEFRVGKGGRAEVRQISFDEDYRSNLVENQMSLIGAKILELDKFVAQKLRESLSDGLITDDLTWFDPYFILRRPEGTRFYLQVEKDRVTIDFQQFPFTGYPKLQPRNLIEKKERYAFLQASLFGSSPFLLYLSQNHFDEASLTLVFVTMVGISLTLAPQKMIYEAFFLGWYASHNPRFRLMRDRYFANSLIRNTAVNVAALGFSFTCQEALLRLVK